ncbi:hypothetical protein CDD83_1858 [Cordyceps sp. RAO-2017]|nr:hypothetical protein CDD83_1858 [Cordyceps sp. RAO-2017]
MASQLAAKQPNRETNRSCGLETPDKCLLLSDRRKQDEYQELIPVWDDEIVKVGRDPLSRVCIEDDADNVVSREHCEVYVVVYDESNSHVYVRDRRSSNGTFVNGVRIGTVESGTSAGYLLEHGDMIEIRPFWTLTFCENRRPKLHRLTNVQETESKLFETKYHISQRCLGQGAEGVVCLATEVETRRQLVCKVVDLTAAKGKNAPDGLRRRLQEADVLRQLQHPNILPYVDAIISPHSLYMFMELATGGDLWSFLYQRGAVSEFETRVIVRQVVRALDYIHHKGVVHRDLKPENILLAYSPNSKCHRIMLSDFGASAVPRRSRMLTHIGTANYQAPEIQGQPQLQTAAVDIWSLGVVALTVLTHHMDDFRTAGLHLLDQARVDAFLEQNVFGGAGRSAAGDRKANCGPCRSSCPM